MERSSEGSQFTVSVTRARIDMDSVQTSVLRGGIGYVRLTGFRLGAAQQLVAALRQFKNDRAAGIVLGPAG